MQRKVNKLTADQFSCHHPRVVLAFDLGASSGRALCGRFDGARIRLDEIRRFPNDPVTVGGTIYWDILRLYHEMKQALCQVSGIDSIGIDTWGTDFGLLDRNGRLMANPVHYRDRRTEDAVEAMDTVLPREALYRRTGIQLLEFNTIYQLFALNRQAPDMLQQAGSALMIPDLLTYFLTGRQSSEYSAASTTGLLDPWTRTWDEDLMRLAGLRPGLFPPVVEAGSCAGSLTAALQTETGLGPVPVIQVAAHDTASAVAAIPAQTDDFIYISSGTWSLMGIEIDQPVINERSYSRMFTNEGGFGGTIRFLKNITGLWLLQESRRQWRLDGQCCSYEELDRMAAAVEPFRSLIDPDDPAFTLPGNMPQRIRARCEETGQPAPGTAGELVRCIYESLALTYRTVRAEIEAISGRRYSTIHVIGGGSQDDLLSQMTADATGCRVIAGPSEATALGNIAVQLIALGELADLGEARQLIRASTETRVFEPGDSGAWAEAAGRFNALRHS